MTLEKNHRVTFWRTFQFEYLVTGDLAPNFIWCLKNTELDQSLPIQTPVALRPSAGRNPDWSIKANFHLMISVRGQCATGKIQRNNYHHRSCWPSVTGPKGNIVILLFPLELKSDFISI